MNAENQKPELSKQDATRIAKAVQQGQKIIKNKGTKVEASMAIFRLTHDLKRKLSFRLLLMVQH